MNLTSDQINIDPPILGQCVEHDTKGVALEEFMGGFFKGDFDLYASTS